MKSINISKLKISKTDNLIEWLICFGIFCSHNIEIIILTIAIVLSAKYRERLFFSKKNILGLIFLGLYSIFLVSLTPYSYNKLIQQFLLISFYILAYSIILKPIKNDFGSIFQKYLNISYYVSILGLVQWIIYLFLHVNIFELLYNKPLYSLSSYLVRISSIIDEPGYLSIVLTPAVVYYILFNLSPITYRKLAIFVVFIMTFSAVSYMIMAILILLKLKKKLKYLFLAALGCIVVLNLQISKTDDNISPLDEITMRIEDSVEGIKYFDPFYFENLNLSSYAIISNIWVAIHAPNRLIGTGLGTHEQNYTSIYRSNYINYGLNSQDGYSLFNRVFSEFGILGILLLVTFMYKCFNKRSIINVCAFFLLLSFIIKGGHYVRYGLIFWSFLYFYTRKKQSLIKT